MSRRGPVADTGEDTGAATLALTGLTVAAAVGMGRLFSGSSHLVPFLAAAGVGHAVMWAGRRRRLGLGVNVALALAAVAITVVWLVLPETTFLGLPTTATLRAAAGALDRSWADFDTIVAPVPVSDGFVIAGMAGVGVAAVLADWAAFRMGVLFEALLPSFTLFVFTAALAADRGRAVMVGLYVAAVLAFLVVQQWTSRAGAASWFASRTTGGRGAVVRGGAALGGLAILAGVVVGPALPGADSAPLLALRDADRPGGGRRTTISPLVDIRGRLVEQSDREVFTVRSGLRSYWRLTSLDTFDGNIWSSDASYKPTGSRLPSGVGRGVNSSAAVQEFTISSLSSIWLPAAYRPVRLAGVDDVSFNEGLGSLITGRDTTDGLRYQVLSEVPRLGAVELGRVAGPPAGVDLSRFLRIDGVSPAVARLAAQIARGNDTPFAKARALQDYFQRGFTYNLQARPGHSGRALDAFLFDTREGYCEQFAGAYGVLARLMGLPTRVAVGFTPGEQSADGVFHVRGLNAHAWPEVLLAGAGWVAFEPTPGRGAPGAEDYTGLPEQQAQPADPRTATTAAPTTTVVPGPDGEAPATTVPAIAEPAPGRTGRPLVENPLLRLVFVALAGAAVTALA
ncbi:MAG: transglutaminaseTgpA domain-containing protein, partial [Acidimicrobiales bacterium]